MLIYRDSVKQLFLCHLVSFFFFTFAYGTLAFQCLVKGKIERIFHGAPLKSINMCCVSRIQLIIGETPNMPNIRASHKISFKEYEGDEMSSSCTFKNIVRS